MNEKVEIDFASIPEYILDARCRTFSKLVHDFYQDPENKRKYEEWAKTEEGQRANLRGGGQ